MSYFPDTPHRNLHAFAFSHRSGMKHNPVVIWMTGLSASGKSTIADALDDALQEQGRITAIIDGDSVRGGCAETWVLPTATATRISGVSPRWRG